MLARPAGPLAHQGEARSPGTLTIVVTGADGRPRREYHQVYDLELLGFKIRSRNLDGVFEPDEEILVTDLRLRNRLGADRMPTPPDSRVKIYFKQRDYLESSGEFEMNESLAPGEEKLFAGPLVVKIRDLGDAGIPEVGEAWIADQEVNPSAELESVQHEFNNFQAGQTIHVRFPIEVTPISCESSMARGERKKILWRVRNVSSRAFGSRSELGREIRTRIRRDGGGLAEKALTFHASDGSKKQLDVEGFVEAIENLAPYDGTSETEAFIEGHLEIDKKAPAYDEARLRLDLFLGRIGDPAKMRRIQGRARTVRVAQAYGGSSKSDLLLVANSSSSRSEIEAWGELAECLGLRWDIWDLSYNKGFNLTGSDPTVSGERLVDHFAGKTVVVLNNSFEVAVGEDAVARDVVADEFIDSTAFLEAVADNAVSFLLVGNAGRGGDRVIRQLMHPGEPSGSMETWDSPQHFLRDLRIQARQAEEGSAPRSTANELATACRIRVARQRYAFAFTPKSENLDTIARRTLARADRLFPNRRYRVTPRLTIRRGQRLWWTLWILKEYDLGEIEITRCLDRPTRGEDAVVTTLDADEEMHTRRIVLSPGLTAALIQSLKLERKLEVLKHLHGHGGHGRGGRDLKPRRRWKIGKAVVDAILAELAVEQVSIRSHAGGIFSQRRLRARLPKLRTLAESYFWGSSARPESEEAELLVRLIAGIEHLARSQGLWRTRFLRAASTLLPLVAAGFAVFFGVRHLAEFEVDLLRAAPEVMPDNVYLPGLPYAFAPEIYYFLPVLLAPVLSLLAFFVLPGRNARVTWLTASWARALYQRLFSEDGEVDGTRAEVEERVKTLHNALTNQGGYTAWLDRPHDSMEQMLAPITALTTDDQIFHDPWSRFLSAEELDDARAESMRRSEGKKSLEADMELADEALS